MDIVGRDDMLITSGSSRVKKRRIIRMTEVGSTTLQDKEKWSD